MKDEENKEEVAKSVSIVDEARDIRDEIVKAKEDLQKENDRQQKLQADELLSSSAGRRIEPIPEKKETPVEYKDRIEKEGL